MNNNFVTMIQILWLFIWGSAAYVNYLLLKDASESGRYNSVGVLLAIFLLLSFHWAYQLGLSVIQCTIAGTVACWWFQPEHSYPVRQSLARALSTQFGSLCFGSFLIAFLRALRDITQLARDSLRRRDGRSDNIIASCLLMMVEIILNGLQGALTYFNRYAIVYVSVYGEDFLSSGTKVTELFSNR